MESRNKIFEEIAAGLRSEPRKGKEIRGEARVGLRLRATLVVGGTTGAPSTRSQVWITNMSVSGLGFRFTEELAAKSLVLVEIPRRDGEIVKMLCRLQNVRPVSGGVYQVGAKIIRIMGNELRPPAHKAA